jgi:lipopolysaccharide biosynthesis protein
MTKLIAFHLPQYHPIPENDEWWGKGFTEWTNVAKAKPLFKGHYQPHFPADLGYYDLRLPEARQAQAELARQYGIHGFCYYHYWFQGKRLLEKPLDAILHSKEPNFPFMLCWANENWTRRWDGGDQIILMEQNYTMEDALAHIQMLLPFFKDERYIKIDGKPFFAIYRSPVIPNLDEYLQVFRNEAAKEGLELYIARVESHHQIGATYMPGFEAAIEFQPFAQQWIDFLNSKDSLHGNLKYKAMRKILRMTGLFPQVLKNLAFEYYSDYVDFTLKNYKYPDDYVKFPGVTPAWDNTARRGNNAFLLRDSTPEKFKEWLVFHRANYQPISNEENFLFINAWNEWAEGNHLEPDRKWGHAYLEAVKAVFAEQRDEPI